MTSIPIAPVPALSADGRLMAAVQASWVVVVATADGAVDVTDLPFEPGTVAVSPRGQVVAVAGEGRVATLRGDGWALADVVELPMEEPRHLVVDDDGTVAAVAGGIVVRRHVGGEVERADVGGDVSEELVLAGGAVFVSGGGDRGLVAFDTGRLSSVDVGVPQDAAPVGDRVGVLVGPTLTLVAGDGASATLEVGDVERLTGSPSGRTVLTVAVAWDGTAHQVTLEAVDSHTGERRAVDGDGLGPDVQLAVDDDGGVVAAWGANVPARLFARRLGGDHVEVDLDALLDEHV
jgi:dipeptidyl aminopeptidase/acylaminoacyl peptidase